MIDEIINNFNQQRTILIKSDRRFSSINNKLHFDGINTEDLAKKYGTPIYVFSEKEIVRNIDEIKDAFVAHDRVKIFFASKACSVMSILKSVKNTGICAEANSIYEVRKCLEIGFKGN